MKNYPKNKVPKIRSKNSLKKIWPKNISKKIRPKKIEKDQVTPNFQNSFENLFHEPKPLV